MDVTSITRRLLGTPAPSFTTLFHPYKNTVALYTLRLEIKTLRVQNKSHVPLLNTAEHKQKLPILLLCCEASQVPDQ